jgi:SAM-dependent methyltransferase
MRLAPIPLFVVSLALGSSACEPSGDEVRTPAAPPPHAGQRADRGPHIGAPPPPPLDEDANPALALGVPGSASLAPTLAVLAYLEGPSQRALEQALAQVRSAPEYHLNAYLEAFLLAEAGREEELASVLTDKLGGREATWRFFFQVHRDELSSLLALQPSEICYLHRVELWLRSSRGRGQPLPASLVRCPVHGTPLEALPEGERVGSASHRCPRCDATRREAAAVRLWPAFQQVAWDSHGADRVGRWIGRPGASVPPERVFRELGFEPGMVIADIGAGEGWFTIPFARQLGSEGHLWAEDIAPGFLDFIAWRAEDAGLDNVTTVLGEPTDVKLPPDTMDRVFVCEVYKYICTNAQRDDPEVLEGSVRPFVTSLRRALKDDGRLVFVEHDDPITDPKATAPALIIEQVGALGFHLVERSDAFAPRQVVLVFEKSTPEE